MGLLDFWKKKSKVKDEPQAVEVQPEIAEPAVVEPIFKTQTVLDEPAPVFEEQVVETVVEPVVAPEPIVEPESVVESEPVTEPEPAPERTSEAAPVPIPAANAGPKTEPDGSRRFASRIRSLFSGKKFDPSDLESLADALILADFGVQAADSIVDEVRRQASLIGASTEAELKAILISVLTTALSIEGRDLNLDGSKFPYVFLVVGVNGVGKTTTIGKLASWLREGEWNVVIGAADTFRAAAVDQIATWAERSGTKLVRPKSEGQDPASVAFEAVEVASQDNADIVIIDTAGRLQNKQDLMDELGKIRRVVEKTVPVSEVLLVIDATTGQNGLQQAKAFAEVAQVTGVVLTKVDGTAKGGIVYSIQRDLGFPVKLIGFGEGINDFAFFEADEFARGLVGQ